MSGLPQVKVVPFQTEWAERWDSFVEKSRNGYFQMTRRFLTYHRDRFQDASFVLLDEAGEWRGVVPAASVSGPNGKDWVSHPGATFAGWAFAREAGLPYCLAGFAALTETLNAQGFRSLSYKALPAMYHLIPSEDDRYALFLAGAALVGQHVLPTVGQERLAFQERRTRGIRKAEKGGLVFRETPTLAAYWDLVAENLREHGASPVHSLEEITELKKRFPTAIRLFEATLEGKSEAGVLVFETPRVARAQYIGSTAKGKSLGALDFVFERLLNRVYADKPYFEFGTSTTDGGRHLSLGICDQKEGFGARTSSQDVYRLELAPGLGERIRACVK